MRILISIGVALISIACSLGIALAPIASNSSKAQPTASTFLTVSITLGPPQQLFHESKPDALGMKGVPDQPLTPLQQPDGSYHLFIVGGTIGGMLGSTGLISTKDFLTYTPVAGTPTKAQTVFNKSCPGDPGPASCVGNFDANYAGADLVFPASNGKDLLMLYQGTTKQFGTTYAGGAFYSVVALAKSTDNGSTWTRLGPVITGSDPKPSADPKNGANGVDQSGAIVANGYIYDFYPYFPSRAGEGGSTIQVARAPVASDGAPGMWTKYYNGAFNDQPGLGGLGSAVAPSTSACTRPAQPWLTFNTYLNRYVMLFICQQGWFFSTSTDLVNWAVPSQLFAAPAPEFSHGQQTDENLSLVTPGNQGQVTGQSGYVLYASTPAWGKTPHELWMRPFTFDKK
jgi:hypothetical protein